MPEIGKGATEDDLPNMANPDPTGTTENEGQAANPSATAQIVFDSSKIFDSLPDNFPLDLENLREDRIWDLSDGVTQKDFFWTKADGSLVLGNVSLVSTDSSEKDFPPIWVLPERPREDGTSLNLALFDDGNALSQEEPVDNVARPDSVRLLTLRVDWTKEEDEGFTLSPYFAVIDTRGENALLEQDSIDMMEEIYTQIDQNNDALNGRDGEEKDDSSGGAETDKDGGEDNSDGSAESTASEAPTTTAQPSDDDDGGDGGSTLSTGAIAGIAVGGAVVLIALAVLAWFALRRRRRNKANGRGELSQSPNPSNHYIGSKEGHDGDLNSPYSEDANITQQTPLDPNAPRARATESPASFTPYQDVNRDQNNLARVGTNASVSTHSNSPVESRTRGLPERSDTAMSANQNVAHLVEDGMTADDIRRLEEEEAQLDFEIERAGRR